MKTNIGYDTKPARLPSNQYNQVYRNDSPCENCKRYEWCAKYGRSCQASYKYITDFRTHRKWKQIPSKRWTDKYNRSEYN